MSSAPATQPRCLFTRPTTSSDPLPSPLLSYALSWATPFVCDKRKSFDPRMPLCCSFCKSVSSSFRLYLDFSVPSSPSLSHSQHPHLRHVLPPPSFRSQIGLALFRPVLLLWFHSNIFLINGAGLACYI